MSEYTKGEWGKVLEKDVVDSVFKIPPSYVAEVGRYYIVSDESLGKEKADAQLIATAPKLLNGLEKAIKLIKNSGTPVPKKLEKIIKKAKGGLK